MVLSTGAGTSDVYGRGFPRTKEWSIAWDRLNVAITKEPSAGRMLGVRAEIFTGEAAGATATADVGQGSKENKQLELHGHVVVTSKDKESTMKCDSIKYVAASHRFYATGNVRFTNTVGSVGPFPQLIATADLKKFATPKEFDR